MYTTRKPSNAANAAAISSAEGLTAFHSLKLSFTSQVTNAAFVCAGYSAQM